MANGKRFICLWLGITGIFAHAEGVKKPADRATGIPKSCDAQMRPEVKLHYHLMSIVEKFPQLPPEALAVFVDAIAYGPPETMAILLDLTRGVFDEKGQKIHERISYEDLQILVNMLVSHGPGIMPSIYYSLTVDRNPEFFIKKLVERYASNAEHLAAKFPSQVHGLLWKYEAYFSHVPDAHMRMIFATKVLESPQENFPILLDMTRGVLGDDGKTVVKKPLQLGEVMDILGHMLPALGNPSMEQIYGSLIVRRDPISFYQTLHQIMELKQKGLEYSQRAAQAANQGKTIPKLEYTPMEEQLLKLIARPKAN